MGEANLRLPVNKSESLRRSFGDCFLLKRCFWACLYVPIGKFQCDKPRPYQLETLWLQFDSTLKGWMGNNTLGGPPEVPEQRHREWQETRWESVGHPDRTPRSPSFICNGKRWSTLRRHNRQPGWINHQQPEINHPQTHLLTIGPF